MDTEIMAQSAAVARDPAQSDHADHADTPTLTSTPRLTSWRTLAPFWDRRSAGEPEQDEQWRDTARHLAHVLGTAHSARYLAEVESGVELWSVAAGEGNPWGVRRLVWRDTASGRLYCEQCGSIRCSHSGAALIALQTSGDWRIAHHEPTAEELEASTQVWRAASGW